MDQRQGRDTSARPPTGACGCSSSLRSSPLAGVLVHPPAERATVTYTGQIVQRCTCGKGALQEFGCSELGAAAAYSLAG